MSRKIVGIRTWDHAGIDENINWLVDEQLNTLDLEIELLFNLLHKENYVGVANEHIYLHKEYAKNMLRLFYSKVLPEVCFVLPFIEDPNDYIAPYDVESVDGFDIREMNSTLIFLTHDEDEDSYIRSSKKVWPVNFYFTHSSDDPPGASVDEFETRKSEIESLSHAELVAMVLKSELHITEVDIQNN